MQKKKKAQQNCGCLEEGCLGLPGAFPDIFGTAIFPRTRRKRRQEPELPDLAPKSQTSFSQTSAATLKRFLLTFRPPVPAWCGAQRGSCALDVRLQGPLLLMATCSGTLLAAFSWERRVLMTPNRLHGGVATTSWMIAQFCAVAILIAFADGYPLFQRSGKEKTHKHKQICGIVLGLGGFAKSCSCVCGSFLMGEKEHINKIPPKIPGQFHETFVYVFFSSFAFSPPKRGDASQPGQITYWPNIKHYSEHLYSFYRMNEAIWDHARLV